MALENAYVEGASIDAHVTEALAHRGGAARAYALGGTTAAYPLAAPVS